MDPLLTLRNALKSKHQIQLPPKGDDSPLQLSPTASFPLNTPTRLRKPGANRSNDTIAPSSHPQDFYTLEAVVYAWTERDASAADYMRRAGERGLLGNVVGVAERRGFLEWLEGRSNDLDGLLPIIEESTTPPGTPPRLAANLVTPVFPTTPGKAQSSSAYVPSHGATASPSKRRYVPDSSDLEVVKKIRQNEVELRDRNTVLRGNKANNFSSIQKLYSEKLKKLREASKSSGAIAAPVPSATVSAKSDPKNLARKARNMHPIIIISSSPTSLITMHNVKMFFQDAMFEAPATARARSASEGNSARGEDVIPIYRKRDIDPFAQHDSQASQSRTHAQKTYFVVDGVDALQKFGADAWDRVVAVLTTGQAWQFKQYKYNEPKSLFHHVKGFYVSWSNDPPNQKIKDWNVTELKIDPNRRHVDKSVVAHFWRTLDTWMMANKPWLMKS